MSLRIRGIQMLVYFYGYGVSYSLYKFIYNEICFVVYFRHCVFIFQNDIFFTRIQHKLYSYKYTTNRFDYDENQPSIVVVPEITRNGSFGPKTIECRIISSNRRKKQKKLYSLIKPKN